MSRISEVLKNKNKYERLDKERRQAELMGMRMESSFRAKLKDDLAMLDTCLLDESVESVTIEVNSKNIALFNRLIYSEDLADYSIKQVDALNFQISRKMVAF